MGDKLIYIPNDDTQNYSLCILQLVMKRLDTQFNESTNQNSLKVSKYLSERKRKQNVIIKL